jgi:deoxyribodipyrimidine photo-lyase
MLWTPPERLPGLPAGLQGLPIPAGAAAPPFPAGEAEALRRLRAFAGGSAAAIHRYDEERNRLDREGTALLSPYLRFGMVSARRAAVAALHAMNHAPDTATRKGGETWLNELIWREFYMAILYHFPFVMEMAFREELREISWRDDRAGFDAWCAGLTGYPVVDAAMRQLEATGWMHNRARMIAASFLVKDLLIDWRRGEQFFMQRLVDGDPAANNGGWQWTAGVGTDAAPYFRIFNPSLQGAKFDPEGAYVRRWLPELARVPLNYLHTPWLMPLSEQVKAGCRIGRDYPEPNVDHALARDRTLAAYKNPEG